MSILTRKQNKQLVMKKSKMSIVLLKKGSQFVDNAGLVHITHPMYTTTNYAIFTFHESNRNTSKAHIKHMTDSMAQYGNLQPIVVVLYNMTYIVVDGQHRFKSLEQRGLPIEFILVKVDSQREVNSLMVKLNNTQKSWSLGQYIDSNAKTVSPYQESYKTIIEVKSKFTNSTAAAILGSMSVGMAKETIKAGTYLITNKEAGIDMLNHFNRFFTETGMHCGQRVVEGLIQFVKDITFAKYREIQDAYIATVTGYIQKGNPEFFKQNMGEREYALLFTEVYRLMPTTLKRKK